MKVTPCILLALVLFAMAALNSEAQSNGARERVAGAAAKVVYDIYGKRLGQDEKYIVEAALAGGRTIAYRRNKKEVDALIKVLREGGITDRKYLNPQTWLMNTCERSSNDNPPCQGGCGLGRTCIGTNLPIDRTIHGTFYGGIFYCSCGQ